MLLDKKTHVWIYKDKNGIDTFKTVLKVPHIIRMDPDELDDKIKLLLPFS
jgi:hypothetical protein